MKKSKELLAQRDGVLAHIETIAQRAAAEERELNAEEVGQRDEFAAEAGRLSARAISAKTEEKAAKVKRAAEAREATGTGDLPAGSVGGNVVVKSSERTYFKGGPVSYMNDLVGKAMGDSGASARLQRHAQEIAVDAEAARQRIEAGSARAWDPYFIKQVRAGMSASGVGEFQARTGDLSIATNVGGEFVPPAYLTAEYIPFARAGRVFADSCNQQDLPPGTMSLNIPKVTSGTATATQATQNTAVQDTALATAFVTFPVVTVAGAQTLSLQLLERSPIPFDDLTFKDLALDLAQRVDLKALAGPGSGDVTGAINTGSIVNTTWTQASPTVTGLYGQIAKTKAGIASARFLPATHAFVTPNRWEWLEQQVDTTGRPLILPADHSPYNAVQVADSAAVAEGATGGRVMGLNVFQDYNIPANLGSGTNQDVIVITKADDLYLYESPVIARALPQTYGNQLTVLLQVYEYLAFTAARYPVSVGVIGGTGLVAPTFAS
jgi:HK97 family phage major capsid protein